MTHRVRLWLVGLTILVSSGLLTSCAGLSQAGSDIAASFQGRSATITTFSTNGNLMDTIHGVSINMTRDTTFDTSDKEGDSKADSSVVLISVGNSTMRHVGSTLLLVEDGITTVSKPGSIVLDDKTHAVPWLNMLRENFQNL